MSTVQKERDIATNWDMIFVIHAYCVCTSNTSHNCDNVTTSIFCTNRVEFTQLAADYKAVNLGQGFPDFAPPKFVQEAFCKAVSGGPMMHQYTRPFVSGNTP